MSDYIVNPIRKVLSVRIYLPKKTCDFRGRQLKKTPCMYSVGDPWKLALCYIFNHNRHIHILFECIGARLFLHFGPMIFSYIEIFHGLRLQILPYHFISYQKSQPQPKPSSEGLQCNESLAPSEWYISIFHIFYLIMTAQGFGLNSFRIGPEMCISSESGKRALQHSIINHIQTYNWQARKEKNFWMAIFGRSQC